MIKICPPIPPGWRGSGVFEAGGDGCLIEIVEPIPIDEVRAAAREEIARRRWEAEVGGVEVAGRLIDTSREARATLGQAAQLGYEGVWKFTDGSFADVAHADLADMVAAVMSHVAACYAAEAAAAAAIDAAEDWDAVQAAVTGLQL